MAFIKVQDLPSKEIVPGGVARVIHTGEMSFVYWQAAAGADFPMHQHPHQQVAHVLEGVFELTVGDDTKILEPGITAVIPGGVPHGGKAVTDCLLLDVFYPEREDYKF
jgi:quercetin dioxygenase-like cupin family protein